MMASFVQVGGAGVGANSLAAWNDRRRFARLSVSEAAIEVRVFSFFWFRRYTFAATKVSQLGVCKVRTYLGELYLGVEIAHTVATYPPSVVFWSSDLETLIVALQQRGFQVERPDAPPRTTLVT